MFTQDQLNAVVRSYSDEIVKLLEVKANHVLSIHDLRKQLMEKNKKIEELEKKPAET